MPHSGKFLIFLSYPMLCLPRVARPPFGVMLWQRRGNYTPYIVIARLGKAPGAEHAHVSRPSPPVIARLGKAEAIQSDNKASLLTGFSGQAQK